jgi:hypothetical protein
LSPEARVGQDHPLRAIRQLVDEVLRGLSPELGRRYSREGRPSIAPEKLLRALVLQLLSSVRSERLRIEECFGWLKTVALLRKLRHRGGEKVEWVFTFACAAYNLVRLRRLTLQAA